jgi:hypothetical protein
MTTKVYVVTGWCSCMDCTDRGGHDHMRIYGVFKTKKAACNAIKEAYTMIEEQEGESRTAKEWLSLDVNEGELDDRSELESLYIEG